MEEKQIDEMYKRVFGQGDGAEVLDDLKKSFFDIHTVDPNETGTEGVNKSVWLAGCRWVVGYIISRLEYEDPPEEEDNQHGRGTYI